MKLVYYDGIKNFGDVLNAHLFPKLFPELPWGEDDDSQFVGIGSILDSRLDCDGKTIVFGTGVRAPDNLPDFSRGKWDIAFVRGPLSAGATDAPYITDAAYCYALTEQKISNSRRGVAFVPHFSTAQADGAEWRGICHDLGFQYIDPMDSFESVESAIKSAELVIAEAMHGAIFADINRIPWIPCRAHVLDAEGAVSDYKWNDWLQSIELEFTSQQLPQFWKGPGPISYLKNKAKVVVARRALKAIAGGQSFLSREQVFEEKCARLAGQVERVKQQYGA